MKNRPVEVWLFHSKGLYPSVERAKEKMEAECRKRNWEFRIRPTHLIKPEGRPIGQIKPEDATNLYRRIHRARVGVWQIEHADVPKRPKPKAAVSDYISLRQFVLHKAFHARLPGQFTEGAWESSFAEFLNWLNELHCENEADPRCLPLHVFGTECNLADLEHIDGRQRFATTHGPQASRVDNKGFVWTRGAFHGQDVLQVAGYELAKGFHWDVAGKHKQHITTTSQVWELKPNGYVNVYPDAHVRGNPKRANQIYPRNKKSA